MTDLVTSSVWKQSTYLSSRSFPLVHGGQLKSQRFCSMHTIYIYLCDAIVVSVDMLIMISIVKSVYASLCMVFLPALSKRLPTYIFLCLYCCAFLGNWLLLLYYIDGMQNYRLFFWMQQVAQLVAGIIRIYVTVFYATCLCMLASFY